MITPGRFPMKTCKKIVQLFTPSNRILMCQTLCKLLLCMAALWVAPGVVRAQLYVSQEVQKPFETSGIGKYNSTTGAVINANLLNSNPNLSQGALVVSGNTIYVPGVNGGGIATFNATTGAPINLNFVAAGGLQEVHGLALSGNTLIVLGSVGSVANPSPVLEYDATTGAPINLSYITPPAYPRGIAVSGNTLFITLDTPIFGVAAYDITTGTAINSSLISGLASYPYSIAVSDNVIYVTTQVSNPAQLSYHGNVGAYDATTGATINASFITTPDLDRALGLAVSGDTLFVGIDTFEVNHNLDSVATYSSRTGALINFNFVARTVFPEALFVTSPPVNPSASLGSETFFATAKRTSYGKTQAPVGVSSGYFKAVSTRAP
jgi:hypothetical protein